MGKKNSNPLASLKSALNTSIEKASTTYDTLSTDITNTASKVIPIIQTEFGMETETKAETKTEIKPVIKSILKKNPNPFEKQIESMFVGCYSDAPTEPTMKHYLGEISNPMECIIMGRKNNFDYVGVQQGNKCFGSNNIPNSTKVDKDTYCNVGCDDINTGNCGGFFYNQVYKTKLYDDKTISPEKKAKLKAKILSEMEQSLIKKNTNELLENFNQINSDVEKIGFGLEFVDYGSCNNLKPINPYILFAWIVILIVLIFMLIEYINNKLKKNII